METATARPPERSDRSEWNDRRGSCGSFATLLAVSILFGLGFGVYEFALPYFLEAHGISVPQMGLLYAVAGGLLFVVRVYAGDLSDRLGRKAMYSLAVGLSGAVSAVTALSPALWLQTVLKSVRDAGATVFDSMYQLALYDLHRADYIARVGKARGLQSFAEALSTFGVGFLIAREAYAWSFSLSAGLFFLGLFVFIGGYRLGGGNDRESKGRGPSLAEVLALDLPRPLLLLTLSGFIFMVGLSTSHCFVMQLFWQRQFGASRPAVGAILMLHRFSIALPLLLVGHRERRGLRDTYIAFVVLEGLALSVSGLIPHFVGAAAVWLTHDLFGAGVWIPIQSALIQRFAREERRGRDVSKVYALAALGGIIGPLLAGAVFERWYGGPFVLSGALMAVSALVLFALQPESEP